jgi:uncharacterized OB-fold protein
MFPPITAANAAFWTSGRTGHWELPRCRSCRLFIHPGQPRCPYCLTDSLQPERVSGTGSVFTFTINRYPWFADWSVPFVVALIELDDQPGLRVTSNLVGVEPQDVRIGLRVGVEFAEEQGRWVPLFRPLAMQ